MGWLAVTAVAILFVDEFTGITLPFERLAYLVERGPVQTVIYGLSIMFLAGACVLILRSRSKIIAGAAAAVLGLGTALELAFNVFTDRGFSDDFVVITLRELGMAPEAMAAYGEPKVVLAGLAGIAVWIALFLMVRRQGTFGPLVSVKATLLVLAAVLAFSTAWRMRFGHFNFYPTFVRPAANIADYYAQKLTVPDRLVPTVNLVDRAYSPERLVLIVDESVRPDFLQLNGFGEPTTPYLDSIGGRLFNLGTAVSGSTCSDASNVMLNSDVRPADVGNRQAILSRPTLFHYAKRAGYKTVFLSAVFRSPMFYGIRRSDLEDIDDVVMINRLSDGPKENNDHLLAEQLRLALSRYPDDKVFVYMRKQGTHFPFDDFYPEDQRIFEPVLADVRPMHEHRSRLLNSYFNGLRWNLDEFYRTLDAELDDMPALYLYTSDHGENVELNERLLHCGRHPTMAMVPLWLDVRGDRERERFVEAYGEDFVQINRDHVSHANVFPTLLHLMGIDVRMPTIFDDLSHQMRTYHPPGSHGTYETLPFDGVG